MGHSHHHETTGNLKLAFFINLAFAIFEFIGGLMINSVAVMSDALHDAGDSLSLGLAWFLQNYSQKEGDQRYTYGYRRYSLLGALLNAVILIVGSFIILSEAVPRLFDPETFDVRGMIIFALVGVAANGFAAYRLRGSSGANAEVVSLHLLEDVMGWIAVLIVGIISLFVDAPILDPLLSIGITLYILYNVFARLKDTAELFLQAVPGGIDLDAVKKKLLNVAGVQDVHHVHVWSLDGEHNVFTAHVVVDEAIPKQDAMRIKRESREVINDLDVVHSTIEIEYCETDCSQEGRHIHDETVAADAHR